ncbi:MAG: Brp/Blh family beta-carotene 15,15'-dioxygenase [Chitinophagales bacterium]|jgi:Brp/Blh family beta-carotene 15,15'-monooxygenase
MQYKASIVLIGIAISLLLLFHIHPKAFLPIQMAVFVLGMIGIGIPHGALDHLLESGNLTTQVNPFFILCYLAMSFGFLILWLLLPVVSLSFFILYSAFHFGQADMREWHVASINYYKNFLWGIFILAIILTGHIDETNYILFNMKVQPFPLSKLEGKNICTLIILISIFWGLWERRLAMILSTCMLAISTQLPLFTSFGLFFIGQHSWNGWNHLKQALKADNLTLFKKAIPFTLGALVLFLLMLYCIEIGYIVAFSAQLTTIFFVFIACISLPHVIFMNQFYLRYFSITNQRKNP